jgi:hypothetical protein
MNVSILSTAQAMNEQTFTQMLDLNERLNRGQITQATFDGMSSLVMRTSETPAQNANTLQIAPETDKAPLQLAGTVHSVQTQLVTTPIGAPTERSTVRFRTQDNLFHICTLSVTIWHDAGSKSRRPAAGRNDGRLRASGSARSRCHGRIHFSTGTEQLEIWALRLPRQWWHMPMQAWHVRGSRHGVLLCSVPCGPNGWADGVLHVDLHRCHLLHCGGDDLLGHAAHRPLRHVPLLVVALQRIGTITTIQLLRLLFLFLSERVPYQVRH